MSEKRPNKVLDTIIRANNRKAKRDIQQWRSALNSAENVEEPKRLRIYNIYDEILLDAHLTSEIEKRKNALIGASFELYDADGNPMAEETEMLRKSWFVKFLIYAFESKLWGHSLLEVKELTAEGRIADIELIPRRHVVPEFQEILKQQTDDRGFNYRNDESLYRWLFEIGDREDLGILNKCVPHVLYKRFAQGAWSEFCEIFGMPVRYAKTNSKDPESLNRLENMLISMATASYAVIDVEEELEFIETMKSDGEVYNGLVKLSAQEISKIINGAVIGENSSEGSRSKEEVGLMISEKIWNGDKSWMEAYINETLLPKLVNFGYPFEGLHFEFSREKDLKSEWDIVDGILNHYDVDPDYITETFGIPVIGLKNNGLPIKAKGKKSFFD